jgi:DNA-binding MarR family transcriptional regulator
MPLDVVRNRMLERLRERGFDDLDASFLGVLQYPGPQGQRPSELADRLRMSKQALNYQLGELERLGYIERRPDPEDGRSRRIVLSQRGLDMARTIRGAVVEMEQEWQRQLGEEKFARLRELLVELNNLPESSRAALAKETRARRAGQYP